MCFGIQNFSDFRKVPQYKYVILCNTLSKVWGSHPIIKHKMYYILSRADTYSHYLESIKIKNSQCQSRSGFSMNEVKSGYILIINELGKCFWFPYIFVCWHC